MNISYFANITRSMSKETGSHHVHSFLLLIAFYILEGNSSRNFPKTSTAAWNSRFFKYIVAMIINLLLNINNCINKYLVLFIQHSIILGNTEQLIFGNTEEVT